ncbi:hypothetical protein BY996DRAFT_6604155 [Phakopsora pachyrhizi]|nr:hypothetical protein BY996DRAFT_6604155 [Phakopsora pachyrhizi]
MKINMAGEKKMEKKTLRKLTPSTKRYISKIYRKTSALGSNHLLSEPQEGSITLEKGPMIFSESKKRVVDYSEMTSSIATKSLELVQNHLRKIKKPKFQVFHQPEHIAENLDEVYFLNMQNSFISEFRDTVKSFERAKSLRKVPYDITKFGYNELNGNKFFSMEELALRSLDYLSQASSEINGVGKTIVREVLKDKEVLEIIKSRFTNVFMHPKLGTDLYVDFEDFVKHNEWTKGISNIFSGIRLLF